MRERPDVGPPQLAELSSSAANFRLMMNAYADEYVSAMAGGRGRLLIAAMRSYIDPIECEIPAIEKNAEGATHDRD